MTFRPQLTPVEMLTMGVFGGAYWRNATEEDFHGLGDAAQLARANQGDFRVGANYYQARAGESYEQWMANGWIFPEDPLGWFQWYCRYHAGRRHERDEHQIRRHNHYRGRWGRFARTQALTKGFASNVVKQGLLQWALDPMSIIYGDD